MWSQVVLFVNLFFFFNLYVISAEENNYNISDTSKAIFIFEKAKIAKSKGEYSKALNFYQELLDIKKNYPGKYEPDVIRIYNNIGNIYLSLQQTNKSLEFFDRAETSLKEKFGGMHNWLATIYMNKGIVSRINGDYEKALFFYNQSLKIYKNDNHLISQNFFLMYHNIGSLYYHLKNYEKALEYFNEIYNFSKNYKIPALERVYTMLGMTYVKLCNFKEADQYYKKSISFSEKKYGHFNYETATRYFYYGIFCAEQGNFNMGLDLQNKAYKIFLETVGFNNLYTSRSLLEIGNYYVQTNRLDSALNNYQEALLSIAPEFTDTNYYANPEPGQSISKVDLAQILKKKAVALQLHAANNPAKQEYYLGLGLAAYERAIETIEQLRSGYLFEESKLFLTENEKGTYSELIASALKLYRLAGKEEYADKAYVFAEKSKAAVLLASLQEVKAKQVGNIPDSLQEKEMNINREIAVYEKFVYDEKGSNSYDTLKVEQWESTIFNLYREKENLLSLFESEYPAYHKLKYDNRVTGLKIIQARLKKDEALLEYVLADSVLYSFVVTKDTFKIIEQQAGQLFISNVEEFSECLSTSKYGNYSDRDLEKFIHAAYDLYKVLILPVESLVKDRKLTIIPDGELAFIPMGALLDNNEIPEDVNFAGLPYLIRKYDFSYAYSATLLMDAKAIKVDRKVKIGAFTPDYTSSDFIKLGNEEVLAALETYPGDLFELDEATEKNFKKVSNEYNILHLSMHGLVDMEDPMYSKLLFTMDKDSSEDGSLYAHEIYNMRINANMVVLSACNTGAGKLQKGEGVMSLARAFTYAGCPAVITTLWPVVNATGTELMTGFYNYLSHGKEKSRALSLSKSDYLENAVPARSHPHYWAGYVVIGDPKAMSSGCPWYCYFGVVGFIVVLGVVIKMKLYKVKSK